MDYEEFLSKQDEPGILRSRDYFNTLIKGEIEKGIKPSRIVLGGFSQGGAMSLFTGITGEQKLGGVFGLSCYLLLSDRIKKYIPENFPNKDTPFFMAHGKEDEVVKYNYGVMSKDALVDMGINVEFHDYEYVPFSSPVVCMFHVFTLPTGTLATPQTQRRSKPWSVSCTRRCRPRVTDKLPLACDWMVLTPRQRRLAQVRMRHTRSLSDLLSCW